MLIVAGGTLWLVRRASDQGRAWSREHQLALASGVLALFILLSPVQETRGLVGKSVLGLAAAMFLWWMRRHIRSPRSAPREAGAYA
jgi:hypothetical protein